MKASDLKIVAIILSIALFFTILTSNAVSIASVVLLAKGGTGAATQTVAPQTDATQQTQTNNGGYVDNSGSTVTPDASTQTTPSGDQGATAQTPSGDQGATSQTPSGNQGAQAQKPAGNQGAANADQWDKAKVFNFYKKAAHDVATNGTAGYNKIEFQQLPVLDMGAASTVLKPVIDGFMTTEEEAEVQVSAKGSDDAKRRFPDCTLTDLSKVASATKTDLPNGNYKITIIMMDEDTPMNEEASFLAQVTDSILFWDGIQETIDGLSVIEAVNSKSVLYNDYKIEAEITKDGKFVSLLHAATVDISANATINLGIAHPAIALSGQLLNTCKFSEFKY